MAVLDTLWMQHLENMQHLREGIHWRGVGQRDPLVEYRSESQKLFDSLQSNLRDEALNTIFRIQKSDAVVRQSQDDEYDTELTRLAESAVERGVNELGAGESNRDDDFSIKRKQSNAEANRAKNSARKKKKASRQNRKKNRK
jgi:preprotein translocase subunit SecA